MDDFPLKLNSKSVLELCLAYQMTHKTYNGRRRLLLSLMNMANVAHNTEEGPPKRTIEGWDHNGSKQCWRGAYARKHGVFAQMGSLFSHEQLMSSVFRVPPAQLFESESSPLNTLRKAFQKNSCKGIFICVF